MINYFDIKQSLVNHFGERLIRKTVDNNVKTLLSTESYDLLVHVGLPTFDDFISFETDEHTGVISFTNLQYVQVGLSASVPVCIKVEDNSLVLISNDEEFINSSIIKFLQSLMACEQFDKAVETKKYGFIRDNRLTYSNLLLNQLSEIDSKVGSVTVDSTTPLTGPAVDRRGPSGSGFALALSGLVTLNLCLLNLEREIFWSLTVYHV